jgi:ABC-type Fe3+ transport system permease subunit
MTAAPGGGVLSLRIYNYLHYGASDIVARLGLILALLVTLAVTLPYVLLVARGKRNTGPPAQGS